MNEYLRRIDERDYLTEREHREYLKKLESDLEVLEILKPFLKSGLHIDKMVLAKKENKIYKGYLPKDYNKAYFYKWDYHYSIWDVFRNEENAKKLKQWLEGDKK